MTDHLILGDNAFFGINHHSASSGADKARYFQDPKNVVKAMKAAYEFGAGGVMLSAHETAGQIVAQMLSDRQLREHFTVYPNIPYLMKYVSDVTKHGMMGAMTRILAAQSGLDSLRHLVIGGMGFLQKDYYQWLKIAIDVEMAKYKGARVGAIFLHNGFVDLALGLGMKEPFLFYNEYIRQHYKTTPGFGTLNLPKLVTFLKECGLKDPLVMAPFNAAGFHMNPSRQACEEVIRSESFTLLAMNVMVSGAMEPRKALEYVQSFGAVRHLVLGASSRAHIEETFTMARKCLEL